MGNEKRNAANAEARSNYLEAKRQADLAEAKKEKIKSILIKIGVILAVVLVIGVIVYKNLAESGFLLRNEVAVESENFEVDGAMMAYFFNNQYQNYADYISYFGIDTSKSLKDQKSVFGGTWFDYFMELTCNYTKELLALCEAAKAAGYELSEEDEKSIDDTIAQMEMYAAMYGYTFDQYLVMTVGAGIKEKDVRNAMELTTLATAYATEYQESLNYTKEQCEEYYAENVDDFDSVDMLMFTITRSDFAEKDEDGKVTGDLEEAGKKAEEFARRLAGATTEEQFKAIAKEYLVDVKGEKEENIDKTLGAMSYEDELKTSSAHKEQVLEWAFSAEAATCNIFTEDDEAKSELYYNVYYLASAAGRDETPTRNIRHILFNFDSYATEEEAKADAEKIYAEWEAAGFTEEKFLELNKANNDDTGSVENGGLYEKVAPGDMVDEFDAWLFDAARKEADHGLIETEYGWHIMSYVGESDVTVWQRTADETLRENDFRALLDKYEASVEINEGALGHVAA